jgi:CO/xanthine dehydrogenase Mo-binding subunit
MTRRVFIKTASGVVAVTVLGLSDQARAQASPANMTATPGVATQRIDGLVKVTGQKVFARDFSARDMAGWPATQWHALYVYALTTDHKFLSLDLALTGASRAAVQRNLPWMEARGLIREMTGQGRYRMWRAEV